MKSSVFCQMKPLTSFPEVPLINGGKKRKFSCEDLREFLNVGDGEYQRMEAFLLFMKMMMFLS